MSRTVSAADANRQFSTILGQAAEGETVIITRRGAPIAQLVPYRQGPENKSHAPAWDRLLATLEEGVHLGEGQFDRDSLYDR
ncbi:type II toxin-antitoxin system Phd/YefM family antitoxin [Skermanella pratensis]|uniref:type II toxin-antitoxin system Phd/YefM family antitoxin n=1 Tax=Skermanella pratensis TaxID=2233999 RepID=UPI0013015181|nr:type II toxin-antitoxin system prevent-host-death family antitoxin [Skermanella pratensis]